MFNSGQWRMKHKYAAAAGSFVFVTTEMEISRTDAIWPPCRVYDDHCTSVRWPITSGTYKCKFQKELTFELEMCWNNVWRLAERQQESTQKRDPVHERKPQLKKQEDSTNSSLKQNTWITNPALTMKFSILLISGRSNREVMLREDGCSPSRRTNKATSSRQRQDWYWEVSKTNRRNISRQILPLPQDLDFGLSCQMAVSKSWNIFSHWS